MTQEERVNIKEKIWTKKEKWMLLWAMEYARQKGVRKESAYTWEQIIRRLCPDKINFNRAALNTKKNNILKQKTFRGEIKNKR